MKLFKTKYLFVVIFIIFSVVSSYTFLSSAESESTVENSKDDSEMNSIFEDTQKQILQEFKYQKKSTELYALISQSGWGPESHISITMDNGKAALNHTQQNGRFTTRYLKKSEIEEFLTFIKKESIDNLKPFYNNSVCDGTGYLYIHASKGKSTIRVYFYSPGKEKEVYCLLAKKFNLMVNEKEFSVNYEISKKLKETKVMIQSEKNKVLSVWKQKSDFRVLIEENGDIKWRKFNNNVLGKVAPEPQGVTLQNSCNDIPDGYINICYDQYPWKSQWGDFRVRLLSENDTDGIWLTREGKDPILLKEGTYVNTIVIPGTDWVIAVKASSNNGEANELIKINIKTNVEKEIDISSLGKFHPLIHLVAYIPEQKKVLLSKIENNPNTIQMELDPEYLLYDVNTEKIDKTNGYFEPICQQTYRPLQRKGKNNEYWAAIPDYKANKTDFGVYNAKTLKFTKLFSYEGIEFNSMDMWVDYDSKQVYVVTNNDLLQLPFVSSLAAK